MPDDADVGRVDTGASNLAGVQHDTADPTWRDYGIFLIVIVMMFVVLDGLVFNKLTGVAQMVLFGIALATLVGAVIHESSVASRRTDRPNGREPSGTTEGPHPDLPTPTP